MFSFPNKTKADDIINAIHQTQAVIQFGFDGTIKSANNFLQLMGYQLTEVVAKHHRIFVEDKDACTSSYHAVWDELRRGKPQTAEFKRITKTGQAGFSVVADEVRHLVSKAGASAGEINSVVSQNQTLLRSLADTPGKLKQQHH